MESNAVKPYFHVLASRPNALHKKAFGELHRHDIREYMFERVSLTENLAEFGD